MIAALDASIFHARHRPRRNAFRYSAVYLALATTDLRQSRPAGLFSIDRPNLFGLRTGDYGDRRSPPDAWIRTVLAEWNLREADGEIVLVTMPRVFGFVFNPVSFWLCLDKSGRLRGVLAEVNNTFGERHSYLCFHDDHRPIAPEDRLHARKVFHVSPFIDVKGEYRFRFSYASDRIAIAIDLFDDDGLLLSTTIGGPLRRLTAWRLLRALLINPLLPFKVVGLIHYQALKLWLKKIRHFRKPMPPAVAISD
ncbi:MAG: DUF1365 domain-containing protein [Rhizomicrobium sp.]|jgi:DUF1365 family protein